MIKKPEQSHSLSWLCLCPPPLPRRLLPAPSLSHDDAAQPAPPHTRLSFGCSACFPPFRLFSTYSPPPLSRRRSPACAAAHTSIFREPGDRTRALCVAVRYLTDSATAAFNESQSVSQSLTHTTRAINLHSSLRAAIKFWSHNEGHLISKIRFR